MTDTTEPDDYDEFLKTFDPNNYPALLYATLEHNLGDEVVQERFLQSANGGGIDVLREPYAVGIKEISTDEHLLNSFQFFTQNQPEWSAWFIEALAKMGIPDIKIDAFIDAFSSLWIDGSKRRQLSPEMLAIKASIKQHDEYFHHTAAGLYVLNQDVGSVEPLLNPFEMSAVFDVNERLLEACIPQYLVALHGPYGGSWTSPASIDTC